MYNGIAVVILPLFLFFIGLFIGSFLLVIIDRLPRGRSFVKGRSECDTCRHVLSGFDLIPVISYLAFRRKCRYCHSPLSAKYPIVEILTGFLFFITAYSFSGASVEIVIFSLVIVSVFLLIFFIDLTDGIIPFSILFPAIGLTLVHTILQGANHTLVSLISALLVFLFFFLLFALTKGRGMGFGDVVYAFFMGLLLGFPNVVLALYIAFLTGAGVSLILVIRKKKKLRGSTIPFGPFLVLGTFIAYVWGDTIVTYILSRLL